MNQNKAGECRITIKFLFNYCNDLAAIRYFYTELLGLHETHYRNTEEAGWVAYRCAGLEFMYFRADKELPIPNEWTCQPGYDGGTLQTASWSIEFPEDLFPDVYRRIRDAGLPLFKQLPEWRQDSYWGLTTRDPMGVTVEVYTMPAVKPENKIWKEVTIRESNNHGSSEI